MSVDSKKRMMGNKGGDKPVVVEKKEEFVGYTTPPLPQRAVDKFGLRAMSIKNDSGWYQRFKNMTYIHSHDFGQCPYKSFRFNTVSNSGITKKMVVKYRKEFEFSGDKSDIYSLMNISGIGINRFILLYHYLMDDWVPEEIVYVWETINAIKNGEFGFADTYGEFDSGHSFAHINYIVKYLRSRGANDVMLDKVFDYITSRDKKPTSLSKARMKSVNGHYYFYYYEWLKAEREIVLNVAKDSDLVPIGEISSLSKLLTDEQRSFCESFVKSKEFVTILQAPAGHGKSYVCTQLMSLYKSFLVVCPTGKAAKNFRCEVKSQGINNMTGCSTIHSMYYQCRMAKAEDAPEAVDVLVVDESSMVSCETLAMINTIAGVIRAKKILFLGDVFQCAPVGAGYPMYDYMRFIKPHTLNENIRSRGNEQLLWLYDSVRSDIANNNGANCIKYANQYSNSYHIDKNFITPEQLPYLRTGELVIVTYKNKTVRYYNHMVIQALYRDKFSNAIGDIVYRESVDEDNDFINPYYGFFPNGMRLFCTQNTRISVTALDTDDNDDLFSSKSKTLQLTNGSIIEIIDNPNPITAGFIKGNWTQFAQMKVRIDGDTYSVDGDVVSTLQSITIPAYAGTVHKHQGSGYDSVFFVIDDGVIPSDVFYTGITRAKLNLSIIFIGKGTTIISRPNPRVTSISMETQNFIDVDISLDIVYRENRAQSIFEKHKTKAKVEEVKGLDELEFEDEVRIE